MHEMAYTQSIIETVLEKNQSSRVKSVTIEVGPLSGIVEESVKVYFDYLTKGTRLEKAKLIIRDAPLIVKCKSCKKESKWKSSTQPRIFVAQRLAGGCSCNNPDLYIKSGIDSRVLEITSI